MWIFQLVLLGLTIVAAVAQSIKAKRRRAAILRTDRPGALVYERPRVPKDHTLRVEAIGGRFGAIGGRFGAYSDRRHAHVTLRSSGIEVHGDGPVASLPWDRYRDRVPPARETWTTRVDANDGGITSLIVEWGRGASTLPESDRTRSAKLAGAWHAEEWACFAALVRVLVARRELRPKGRAARCATPRR